MEGNQEKTWTASIRNLGTDVCSLILSAYIELLRDDKDKLYNDLDSVRFTDLDPYVSP